MTLSLLLSILLLPAVAPAEGGTVSGTLQDPFGQPAARVRVRVMAMPEAGRGGARGGRTFLNQVDSDSEGRYRLEDVPAGSYYISAGKVNSPTFYPGVLAIDKAKTIEVRAKATLSGIDFVVDGSSETFVELPPQPLVVKGRVVLNNPGAPRPTIISLQGSRVTPRLTPLAQQLGPLVVGVSLTVAVAADGSFSVTFPAGDLTLSDVTLGERYSVVSVTWGGRTVLNQMIDARARGVDLLVSANVGDARPRYRVLATVKEDNTDRPLAGERVELISASGEVVPLTVNAQGLVTFPGILAGTYGLRLVSAGFEVPEKQVVIADSSVQVELRARKR